MFRTMFRRSASSAVKRACLDLCAVLLPLKIQKYAIARAQHESDYNTKLSEEGLYFDRHTQVLELDRATNARLAKRCHVEPRLEFWTIRSFPGLALRKPHWPR